MEREAPKASASRQIGNAYEQRYNKVATGKKNKVLEKEKRRNNNNMSHGLHVYRQGMRLIANQKVEEREEKRRGVETE